MPGSLTGNHQHCIDSAADYRRLEGCTCSGSDTAQDCRRHARQEQAGYGAGILLVDVARESCKADCFALAGTGRSHSIVTVSVAEPGRTWRCRRRHRS